MIGKFEEVVLLALLKAGPDSYAVEVFRELQVLQKKPAFPATYTTLDRLEKKGLINESSKIDGEGRRLFTINGAGRLALDEAVNATRVLGGFGLAAPGRA